MAELKGTIIGTCAGGETVRTGISKCQTTLGLVKTLLICDPGTRFSVDPNTFNEELRDAIIRGKVIPVNINDAPRTGGDVRTSEVGYGGTQPNGTNAQSYQYRLEDGSECLAKELSKLDGQQREIMWLDENGMVFGTAKTGTNGDYNSGYLGKVQSYDGSPQNDSSFALFLGVYYSANHRRERLNSFAIPLTVSTDGLIGVMLQTTDSTTTIVTSCGGVEVGKDYAADWTKEAFIDQTGGNPTSVAVDPNTGAVTLAPATSYRIAPASILDGLGIAGLDGINTFTTIADA